MIVLSERLTGQLTDPADYQASYGFRAVRWSREIVPILREIGAQQLIRETGFSAGSIYALFRNPPSTPHRRRRTVFEEIAIRHARRRLIEWGERPSRTKRSIMPSTSASYRIAWNTSAAVDTAAVRSTIMPGRTPAIALHVAARQ